MSNLFQISQQLLELQELAEEFVLDEEQTRALQITREELALKMQGYAQIIASLDSQVEMAYAEIERIKHFIERKMKADERLRANMLQALLIFGEESGKDGGVRKLEIGTHRFSTARSKAVEVNDEDVLSDRYRKSTVTIAELTPAQATELKKLAEDNFPGCKVSVNNVISKTKIKEAIDKEETVLGAEIVTRYRLVIK